MRYLYSVTCELRSTCTCTILWGDVQRPYCTLQVVLLNYL